MHDQFLPTQLKQYYITITTSFYIYLDFPSKVSLSLLNPVSRDIFLTLLARAVLRRKGSRVCHKEIVNYTSKLSRWQEILFHSYIAPTQHVIMAT
jgi:hypothetical protein